VDKLAFAVDYEKQKHVGFVGLLKELIAQPIAPKNLSRQTPYVR
jgi:hypothetical protein